MKSGDFLNKLSNYVEIGILKKDVFEEIKNNELEKKELGGVITQPLGLVSDDRVLSFYNIDNAKRFSLGVVAGLGAFLVIVGFGLLTSLIEDFTSDYDNDVRGLNLYWLVYSLLAISAFLTSRIKLHGRAQVFLGEAITIIFGISGVLAIASFLGEFSEELGFIIEFGPMNLFYWFPILIFVVFAVHFARMNDAWVSYSLGWILWFVPLTFAYDNDNFVGLFFSLMIIMIVLISEILREWFDNNRKYGSWIQFFGHGLLLGIFSWNVLFAFGEAFYIERDLINSEYNYGVDNPLLGVIFIIIWMVGVEYFPKMFGDMKYKNSSRNKAWSLIPGCLIFYTYIQAYTGFVLADWFGLTEIELGGFDLNVGGIIALLIYVIMGLQMFKWNPKDVVVKPSLTNPGTFMGSVFLIMSFFTFVGVVIDLLEELAGYLFLPIGLLVLIFGTKKLIERGEDLPKPKSIVVGNSNEE